MEMDPRIRATLTRVLTESAGWQLDRPTWREIDLRFAELQQALATDDPAMVRDAAQALDGLQPRRITPVREITTGMPGDVRERHNVLIRRLGGNPPDEPRADRQPGDAPVE